MGQSVPLHMLHSLRQPTLGAIGKERTECDNKGRKTHYEEHVETSQGIERFKSIFGLHIVEVVNAPLRERRVVGMKQRLRLAVILEAHRNTWLLQLDTGNICLVASNILLQREEESLSVLRS